MTQYIDKSAVVAEIEKYISNYKGILNKLDKSSDDRLDSTLMLESKIDVLQHILSFLDTLETKEVDLVEEIDKYMKLHHLHIKDGGRIVFKNDDTPNFMCDFHDIAKHFFELGLKTKKGE